MRQVLMNVADELWDCPACGATYRYERHAVAPAIPQERYSLTSCQSGHAVAFCTLRAD